MKVLFTTDLHGRGDLYEQTTELAVRAEPDLVIFGGDMLPDGEMSDPCPAQTEFVRSWLARWIEDVLARVPRCRVATVFGNHDWACSIHASEELESRGLLTILRPDRMTEILGWRLLGYSLSPPSPFGCKDLERLDMPGDKAPVWGGGRWDASTGQVVEAPTPAYFQSMPTIREDLAGIETPERPWIWVSHAPPRYSDLDLLISGQAVGSRAVREFIESREPDISLHGHLHDSPYVSGTFHTQIGRTVSINPGQGTSELAAVTFDTDDVLGTIEGHGIRLPKHA